MQLSFSLFADLQWTHGVGLYGMLKFHEVTGDQEALDIMKAWFRDRFNIGTTKVTSCAL